MSDLIEKARELARRRVVWTADADKFVQDAQPVIAGLVESLETRDVTAGRAVRRSAALESALEAIVAWDGADRYDPLSSLKAIAELALRELESEKR